MSIDRRFASLNMGSGQRAPPANTSTRPTSTPTSASRLVDPYSGLDSWSASGGTALRGRGPRSEAEGLAELPAPPPDYTSSVRDSIYSDGPPTSVGTASSPPRSPSHRSQPVRRTSVEDPLSALARYDVTLLVDDSPSMNVSDHWGQLREALVAVVEKAAKYDRDGVDVAFMNNEDIVLKNLLSADEVTTRWSSIQPFGSTPTAMRLDDILRPYIEQCEDAKASRTGAGPRVDMPKPLVLVVVTDGRADDPDSLKECIVEFAGRLDDIRAPAFQLGIQLVQIGSDEDAAAFLRELDDDIKAEANVRDMVDTTPFTGRFDGDFLLHALLGSVNRRLDARK